MHGSTVKGASNAEPQLRTDSGIAVREELGFADKSSFSAPKNKCSNSIVFIIYGPHLLNALLINSMIFLCSAAPFPVIASGSSKAK